MRFGSRGSPVMYQENPVIRHFIHLNVVYNGAIKMNEIYIFRNKCNNFVEKYNFSLKNCIFAVNRGL